MSGSQSLERGLAILELVNASTQPLGVREIARQLDLSPTIVQRFVKTLTERNYLKQDEATRRYSIGYTTLSLGSSLARTDNLLMAADQELNAIARDYSLNGYLGTLQNNRAVYLLSVKSHGPIVLLRQPGELTYLHTTAMGKVLLASLPEERARSMLGCGPLERKSPSTITDPAAILSHLPAIRQQGYAVVENENIEGIVSIGAPVKDAAGNVVAAISVAYARQFAPELTIEKVAFIVAGSALTISKNLGYPGR
ncbi:IclR family transcriptional regulator [Martelella alba]|uniref:IclR family transcriptional regulator n=1 Tax=Martelella alba TaxID=2590451 RepID=A0ABY2SRD2_9HYPH|nr:IclR family transcriptional regulator [Martelella alba]TKI06594.1 IclR family transcriptional regulator [Martelella alba]